MKNNRKSCKMQDLPVPQRSLTLPEPATLEGSTRPTGPLPAPYRPPSAPIGPHRPLFQPIADVAPAFTPPRRPKAARRA